MLHTRSLALPPEEEEEAVVDFTRKKSRGIFSTRNTRNTNPFKPRTDESLALCHPYLSSARVFVLTYFYCKLMEGG